MDAEKVIKIIDWTRAILLDEGKKSEADTLEEAYYILEDNKKALEKAIKEV